MARLIEEETLAILTIAQEAAGEAWETKVGVAEAIRNRMRRHHHSDGTVSGTVLRAYQFSGWLPGDPNLLRSMRLEREDPVAVDCARAWGTALGGSDTIGGAVNFLNVALTRDLRGGHLPTWAADPADPRKVNAKLVTVILGHLTFLKEG